MGLRGLHRRGREGTTARRSPRRRRRVRAAARWPTRAATSASTPQKQPGLNYIGVVLPVGRLTSGADARPRRDRRALRQRHAAPDGLAEPADLRHRRRDRRRLHRAIDALGLGVEASAIRARPGRLHRQCRLQVLGLQHQGPRAEARRLSRGAGRARPADQHPSHRLPPFLRPALCRRHRPAGPARSSEGEESVEGYHVFIGGGAASTAEQAMARDYAQSVPFDDLPPLLERLLRGLSRASPVAGRVVLRLLPPPRSAPRCAISPNGAPVRVLAA